MNTVQHRREIKSYSRRARLTSSQRASIEQLWSLYGLEVSEHPRAISDIFQRETMTILEIGFGMGQSLLTLAEENPNINFIGIEVHPPGIGTVLKGIAENRLTNLRLFCVDAIEVLEKYIPDQSLAGVLLFFPDPWPKRRHHKRRIVQTHFVELVHRKLLPQGYFHLATDNLNYADHMFDVIRKQSGFAIINQVKPLSNLLRRPKSKFEQRALCQGDIIRDLIFLKD